MAGQVNPNLTFFEQALDTPEAPTIFDAGAQRAGGDPDGYAQDLNRAQETGLPMDTIRRNRDKVDQKISRGTVFPKAMENSTSMTEWAQDLDNSALVSDDPSTLDVIYDTVTQFPDAFSGEGGGMDMLRLSDMGWDYATGQMPEDQRAAYLALSDTVANAEFGDGFASRSVLELGRSLPLMLKSAEQYAEGFATVGIPSSLAVGLMSGPAAPIASPTAFVTTGAAGGTTYMVAENYKQQVGLIFDELRRTKDVTGKPMDEDIARGGAFIAGAPSAVLDVVGIGKLAEIVPGGDKLTSLFSRQGIKRAVQIPGVRQALKRIGSRVAKGIAAEGVTEGMQEAVLILTEEVTKAQDEGLYRDTTFSEAAERVVTSMATGAIATTPLATGVGAASTPFEVARARSKYSPDQVATHIDGINKEVKQNKLHQRSPDRFHSLIKGLTGEEKLYINSEAFNELAQQLPEEMQQELMAKMPYLENEMTNPSSVDISVSKADYTTFLAPLEGIEALRDYIKIDPADFSVAERAELQQTYANNPELMEMRDQLIAENLKPDPRESIAALERRFKKAMQDGGLSAQQAGSVAPLYARVAARNAAAFGQSGFDFMAENNVTFESVNREGEVIKSGSTTSTLFDDLESIQKGEKVRGLDDVGEAAVRDFGAKLEASGISLQQAREMGARQALDAVFRGENNTETPGEFSLEQNISDVDLGPMMEQLSQIPEAQAALEQIGQLAGDIDPEVQQQVMQLVQQYLPEQQAESTAPQADPQILQDRYLSDDAPNGVQADSNRTLYQGPTVEQAQRDNIGLYSALEREVLSMNLPNWKPKKDKQLTEEEQARLDEIGVITSTADPNYAEWQELTKKAREAEGVASGKEIWQKVKSLPIKQEEIEWLGIEEFLLAGTEKFTRDEVVWFIRENGVTVDETVADQEMADEEISRWDQEPWEEANEERVQFDVDDAMHEYDNGEDHYGLSKNDVVVDLLMDEKEYILANHPNKELVEQNLEDEPSGINLIDESEIEEWFLENFADEIRNKYEEKVEEVIRENVSDDPYLIVTARLESSDADIEIKGSDDTGWSIYINGNNMDNGGIHSLSEAQIQAENYAREEGVLTGEEDESVAKWADYVAEGPHTNYREVKLTLPYTDDSFYNETHFPDANIVAFLRVTDRDLTSQFALEREHEKAEVEKQNVKDNMARDFAPERFELIDRKPAPDPRYELLVVERDDGVVYHHNYLTDNHPERLTDQEVIELATSANQKKYMHEELRVLENDVSSRAKMSAYFVDEMQSDWHQDGRQKGYATGKLDAGELEEQASEITSEQRKKASDILEQNTELQELIFSAFPEGIKPSYAMQQFIGDETLAKAVHGFGMLVVRDAQDLTDLQKSVVAELEQSIPLYNEQKQALQEADRLSKQASSERYGVPDAPFKGDNWMALALKRALVQAVDQDAKAFAWADAEVLMDRWSDRYETLYRTQYDDKMSGIVKRLTGQKPIHIEGGNNPAGFGYWAIVLNDKLKEKIRNDSFSLFQQERGSITFSASDLGDFDAALQDVRVAFTERANMSTAAHEFAHWSVAMHRKFATMARTEILKGNGNRETQRLVDDWELLKKTVGADGDTFTVEQEEKIARQFEAYLREGKAPSEGLRRIFTMFRDWLTAIYKELRDLNVDMNDDVRGVFDRWLASEQEIDEVNGKNSAMSDIAKNAGLPENITDKVADYVNSATMHAEEQLYRKQAREQKAMETKAYKDQFEKVREKVVEEKRKEPEYNLMFYMRDNGIKFLEGPETEGIPADLLSDSEGADGVTHPDIVADLFGYTDGKTMLKKLGAKGDFDRSVDAQTRSRLRDKFPDMIEGGRISVEAVDAIMNDKTVLALDLLIKELGRSHNSGKAVSMKQFAKVIAKEQVAKMLMKDVNYAFRYDVARDKSMRDALKASRSGDVSETLMSLQRAMVNQMVFKELNAVKESRAKAEALFKKIDMKDKKLAKVMDMDFINAARHVLSLYGLGGERFKMNEWMEDIQARDPEIVDDLVAFIQVKDAEPKLATELTTQEFRDVHNAMLNIVWVARKMKEFDVADKKYQTEKAVSELVTQLQDRVKGDVNKQFSTQVKGLAKFRQQLSHLKAITRRVELWVSAMDNGYGGPFRQYLWRPIAEAGAAYREDREVWRSKLNDVLQKHKERLREPGKIATGMYDSNGKELVFDGGRLELIGFLLHTGNTSNLEKLLGGYGLSVETFNQQMQVMQTDGRVSKEDWDLVQGLWDFAEDLKPLSQKAHKSLYGYRFDEIDPTPVQTPFGTYRGGYWPAIVNSDLTDSKKAEASANENFKFMIASTNKGFTKSRVQPYKKPLSTDLRLATRHIDQVLRFAYMEPAIRQVNRVMNREEFRDTLKQVDSGAYESMLMPWLRRSAQQQLTEPGQTKGHSAWQRAARFLRVSTSAQAMMGNVANAVQNVTNFPLVVYRVGPRNFMKAFAQFHANPREASNNIRQLSKMMMARQNVLDIDVTNEINEIVQRRGYYSKVRNAALRHGYIFQRITQNWIDNITWMAAYSEQLEKGDGETEAVAYADSIVRETQSSAAPEDISDIEASSEGMKLFLMFYSYFNTIGNNLMTEGGNITRTMGWKGSPKLFYMYVMMVAIPAIVGDLIVKAIRDDLPGDDDNDGEELDDWLAWMTASQARFMAAMVPVAGQGINTVINKFNDNFYDDRLTASPAIENITRAFNAAEKMATGDYDDDSRAVRDSLQTIGFVTGLPLGQLGKPAGYIANVAEGDEEPSNPLDALRGFVGGPAPKN